MNRMNALDTVVTLPKLVLVGVVFAFCHCCRLGRFCESRRNCNERRLPSSIVRERLALSTLTA